MVSSAATFVGDSADAVELTGDDKVLMLIPQAPNSAKIEVTYTATDKTTNIVYNNAPKEVNVPTAPVGSESKNCFHYCFNPW